MTEKFGPFAGWAHNTLFIAELPGVRNRVAEAERLARKEERKEKGGLQDDDSSDDDSSDEGDSESGDERSAPSPPPAKKRNTAAARAAEAAATFNKIKAEEGGEEAVPRTPLTERE